MDFNYNEGQKLPRSEYNSTSLQSTFQYSTAISCSRYRENKEAAFVSPSNSTLLTTDIYRESTVKCKTVQMVVHMPKILKVIATEEIILLCKFIHGSNSLSFSTILSQNTRLPGQTQSTHKQVANVLKTQRRVTNT